MSHNNLGAIKPERKTGAEHFHLNSQSLDFSLLDFWQWSSSDLLNNALRGILAEFLVAQAIGAVENTRLEWHMFDLETVAGKTIEVKSAAYLQSWTQTQLSNIRFSISQTLGWDASTNEYGSESKRQADIYVFALLKHQDKSTVDPMDVNQWSFYVVPTHRLDSAMHHQASIGLSKVQELAGHENTFADLSACINQL